MISNPHPRDARISFATRLSSKFNVMRSTPTSVAGVALESPFSRLPNDVLHQVFYFATCDGDKDLAHRRLLDICRVSRQWYLSAIKYCPLWTTFPPVNFDRTDDLRSIRRSINGVTIFHLRSGTLPISFKLTIGGAAVAPSSRYRDIVRVVIKLLVSQCHRWGAADLKLSNHSIGDIMRIKGRLPLLTHLKLSSPIPPRPFGGTGTQNGLFDLFKDAPQLRCATIETPRIRWGMPSGTPALALPWAQLETFKYTQGEDQGEYSALMDAQPTLLRSLELRTRMLRQLPRATLTTLPHLEKLVIRVQSGIETDLLSHINTLTLPALTHLELWGRMRHSDEEAYDAVSGLVERSRCSLRSLYLCLSSLTGSLQAFSDLLSMSPELEELHMTVPRTGIMRQLVVDPATPIAPLPKLRTLGFHAWYSTTLLILPVDLEALRQVIESRAVVTTNRDGSGLNRALEQMIFVYTSDATFRDIYKADFLSWLHEVPIDPVLEGKAQSVKGALERTFCQWDVPAWRRRYHVSATALARMDKALRDVENLKVKECNTQALVRYGLLRLLHRISQRPDNPFPGYLVLRFRSRAAKLLEKWKPYVLRDARAGEYRWCYYGIGIVSLSRQGSEGCAKSDEELWNTLCGIADECTPYTSLKKWASFPGSFV